MCRFITLPSFENRGSLNKISNAIGLYSMHPIRAFVFQSVYFKTDWDKRRIIKFFVSLSFD
jgi:hypothetical protein